MSVRRYARADAGRCSAGGSHGHPGRDRLPPGRRRRRGAQAAQAGGQRSRLRRGARHHRPAARGPADDRDRAGRAEQARQPSAQLIKAVGFRDGTSHASATLDPGDYVVEMRQNTDARWITNFHGSPGSATQSSVGHADCTLS